MVISLVGDRNLSGRFQFQIKLAEVLNLSSKSWLGPSVCSQPLHQAVTVHILVCKPTFFLLHELLCTIAQCSADQHTPWSQVWILTVHFHLPFVFFSTLGESKLSTEETSFKIIKTHLVSISESCNFIQYFYSIHSEPWVMGSTFK